MHLFWRSRVTIPTRFGIIHGRAYIVTNRSSAPIRGFSNQFVSFYPNRNKCMERGEVRLGGWFAFGLGHVAGSVPHSASGRVKS